MSNIFNQQLGTALNSVGSTLQSSELDESNTVQSAKLGLYHAHGLTSKTEKQLLLDQEKSAEAAEQNKVASLGVTAAQNIITAANAAVLDAGNTTRSASTTAASVQKAATALTNLSGNVATIAAVAGSLDNGSKIQALVQKANAATKKAARLAEEASIIALNLTIEASKSSAANVVSQANTVRTNISTLQKSFADTFSKQQELITSDLTVVSSAITNESQESGSYKTALAELNAITNSENFINKHLNNNLTCVIEGEGSDTPVGSEGNKFSLSFDAFKESEDGKSIISEYRLLIVKKDDASSFTVESAKAVLNLSESALNYVAIKPAGKATYSNTYYTAEYYSIHPTDTVAQPPVACDYNGIAVQRGVAYTFFVYVVYTPEYQAYYDDANGVLSQPGLSFTLATDLPVVTQNNLAMAFYAENGTNAVRIGFKMPASQMMMGTDINLNELMDFRALIFSTKDKNALALNVLIDQASDKLFKLEQTFRTAEENYLAAEQAYNLAIAQGAGSAEIRKLKNELIIAKAQYQDAKSQYNEQIEVVDGLNQKKISDFRVDESIIESLPEAYSLVAALNDKLPTQLKELVKSSEKELTNCKTQIEKTTKSIEEKNEKVKQLNQSLLPEEKEESTEQDNIALFKKELSEKIARFEAQYNKMASIKSEADAKTILEKLSGEEQEEHKLLKEIIALFEKIMKSEDAEIKVSKEISEVRGQLKNLLTEIDLLNARLQMLNDEVVQFNTNMESLKAYQEAIGEKEEGFHYYEAINVAGDFTDNYGETLMGQAKYACLVLSVIKDSEPDAAPLFANRISGFSSDVVFP